jgi:hypothetical protein
MDTRTKAVKDACIDLLKGGQRQMRYRLKMKYFNGLSENQVPKTLPISSMIDEQWLALVNMWSKSEHKVSLTACYSLKIFLVTHVTQFCLLQEKCSKNKINHEKVQFQQRTGSRCYIAQAHLAVRNLLRHNLC